MKHQSALWLLALFALHGAGATVLDLQGYADPAGAISVQYEGDTVDPYFALQALLLARQHGLDISRYALPWASWLMPQQKPDGTFDRFCRRANTWAPCKTADADDALLALWLQFLDGFPERLARDPAWEKSRAAAQRSLRRLEDKGRGIYLVSPVFQHGLLMDNLEVWAWRPAHHGVQSTAFPDFGRAIQRAFWDPRQMRYRVSTQPESDAVAPSFYPDAVAQIFPVIAGFPHVPGGIRAGYARWMHDYRSEWLAQVKTDFAWGLIAVAALDQGDRPSAGCWLRAALPARNGPHWTVTDEVARQVLQTRGVAPAAPSETCR